MFVLDVIYHICYIVYMGYQIDLYEKDNGEVPVLESIKNMDAKMQAKIYREINLLEEFGRKLHEPYIKKIVGQKYSDLWELRIKQSNNIFRIIYFTYVNDLCVLLHGFQKKSQKTPKKELDLAKSRMEDYKSRKKK